MKKPTDRCGSVHPEAKTRCELGQHLDTPHRANGLVWPWPDGSTQVIQSDPVHHPKHYTSHPSGIECIDVTRHMNFNRGNAVKYIWRAGEKGPAVEDLKKSIWYLQDEIRRLEKGE